MTKEQVLQSTALKQRFVRDNKLPLTLLECPYFLDRIRLYTAIWPDIYNKWEQYAGVLSEFEFNSEQDYLEYYNQVKDEMINFIKASDGYNMFNDIDMNAFAIPQHFSQLPSKDIFKAENDGKTFLSIDMIKANFSVLHMYDSSIFGGADTWEKFVTRFTYYTHIIESKYVREVVLGNCNPKRHITYEKYVMSEFLGCFRNIVEIDKIGKIVFFSNDEIVLQIDSFTNDIADYLREAVKQANEAVPLIPLRTTFFDLYHIPELHGYIEHNKDTGAITPKSISGFMMPYLCRKLKGEPYMEGDSIFMHPNYPDKKCTFMDLPKFELPKEIVKEV